MDLKPIERLVLWRLMLLGDGLMTRKIKSLSAPMRKRLCDAGLITVEKKGNAKIVWLNEENAWRWATEDLDADISQKAFAGDVLQEVLTRVKRYLGINDVSLAELLEPESDEPEDDDAEEQIRLAYRKITGDRWNMRVRISALKAGLPEMAQEKLAETIQKMQLEGNAHLYPFDDPTENTKEDEAAAIRFSGETFTIIYING